MPGILQYDQARIMAVCDLDANRVEDGKKLVNDYYAKKTGKPYDGVTGYANYHELLANKDIDAVVISTPDHWHALIAIDAVRAGKDVYLQKPASLTIAEGRAHERRGAGFGTDSPDRQPAALDGAVPLRRRAGAQWPHRRTAARRNRPARRSCRRRQDADARSAGFNYDMWLGYTPVRLLHRRSRHPPKGYGRPGWLRCSSSAPA